MGYDCIKNQKIVIWQNWNPIIQTFKSVVFKMCVNVKIKALFSNSYTDFQTTVLCKQQKKTMGSTILRLCSYGV